MSPCSQQMCSSCENFRWAAKFSGRNLACIWQALTTTDWFPRPPTSFPTSTPKLLSSCWWGISRTSYLICRQKMWDLNVQYRQLIQNIRYASVKQLQKWENKSISLEQGRGGGGRISICSNKDKLYKNKLFSGFYKNSHSGTQQERCTFACTRANSENKICSPQSVYLPISLALPTAHPADWNSKNSMTRQKANTVQLQKFK